MEMSQTGFSAHTSKVSLQLFTSGRFHNYSRFTVNPVNQTETLSHLQIMAEFEWPQALQFMKEGFILRSAVCVCVRDFLGRLLR